MKKHHIIITLMWLALTLITGAGCSSGTNTSTALNTTSTNNVSSSQDIRDVSLTDGYELIQANKNNSDFVIIDVRTPEEYTAGHIEGAILIDFYDDNFKDQLIPLDRSKTYFIYCRTARRSALARDIMQEMGFQHVINMLGGITDWTNKNYPVVK